MMDLLKGIRGVMGFLTIIPMGGVRLTSVAEHMFMFPLAGILIGVLAWLSASIFFHFLPNLVAGSLTLGFIFLITGLHHTDGLVDFGDGLMATGGPPRKIRAMRDGNVGVGGFMLGFVVVLVTVLAISNLGKLLGGLVVSEVSAKFSMVTGAKMGKSAHRGLNTDFVRTMRGTAGSARFLAALAISLVPMFWILGLAGSAPLIGGIVTAAVLVLISDRSFNGLTGDVFGAMNDLSRMVALTLLLVI